MIIKSTIQDFSLTEEILDLAKHQLEILERRFPEYKYILYKSKGCWVAVETGENIEILMVSFFHSHIRIAPFSFVQLHEHLHRDPFNLDYADPKFTDDFLSDILRELVEMDKRGLVTEDGI